MCVLTQVSAPSGAGGFSQEIRWIPYKPACFCVPRADGSVEGGSASRWRILVLLRVFAPFGSGDASPEMHWIPRRSACFWACGADERFQGGSAGA